MGRQFVSLFASVLVVNHCLSQHSALLNSGSYTTSYQEKKMFLEDIRESALEDLPFVFHQNRCTAQPEFSELISRMPEAEIQGVSAKESRRKCV